MSESHSVRIREKRWKEIEKKAWKLSQEAGVFIKPTDIVDAVLALKVKEIELSDIAKAKQTRD
jgi:hypothetical protein